MLFILCEVPKLNDDFVTKRANVKISSRVIFKSYFMGNMYKFHDKSFLETQVSNFLVKLFYTIYDVQDFFVFSKIFNVIGTVFCGIVIFLKKQYIFLGIGHKVTFVTFWIINPNFIEFHCKFFYGNDL